MIVLLLQLRGQEIKFHITNPDYGIFLTSKTYCWHWTVASRRKFSYCYACMYITVFFHIPFLCVVSSYCCDVLTKGSLETSFSKQCLSYILYLWVILLSELVNCQNTVFHSNVISVCSFCLMFSNCALHSLYISLSFYFVAAFLKFSISVIFPVMVLDTTSLISSWGHGPQHCRHGYNIIFSSSLHGSGYCLTILVCH